jgi:two-component system chemotaxis sensor kinase CheA
VAVVLVVGDKQLAFAVDAVLNETEVLVKPFHKPLARVRNVAGATILGSGKVVPLLNVADLLKSAIHAHPPPRLAAPVAEKQRRTVLVVEDSITSRMLLKNILESAGYRVKTAVDGVDALTALKVEDFDAVVSDIEMPRLNGFGLTEKIRGDKKLANLPVVLVTALETAADRERGVDVGANAYIVKSSFDQSNLLEVIERLV